MSDTKRKSQTNKHHTRGELDSDNLGTKKSLSMIKKIAERKKRKPSEERKQNMDRYNSNEGDIQEYSDDEDDVKPNGVISMKSESGGAIGTKRGKARSSIYERENKTTENKQDLATLIHGEHHGPSTRPAMAKGNRQKTNSLRENSRPLPDPQERVKRSKSSCGHLTGQKSLMVGNGSSVRFQPSYDEGEDDMTFNKDGRDISKVMNNKDKANPKATSKIARRNQSSTITTTFTMSASSTNDLELYKSSKGSRKATHGTRTPDSSSNPKPNAVDVRNNSKTATTSTSIAQEGTRKEKVRTSKTSQIPNLQTTSAATALSQSDGKRSQKRQHKSEKAPTTEEATKDVVTLYPIKVECCEKEIATLDVDVIVSSEDGQLQGDGMVAHHLEENGGPLFVKLKKQTLEMYEDKVVPPWEFSSSPGKGRMKCKRVFHAHALKIQHCKSQADWHIFLGQLYQNLFVRADAMGFTSIAVPLLGTGRNGAPNSFVIDLIGEAILRFMLRSIEKRFLTIIYIVHPNPKVVAEIEIKIQEKTETLKGMKLADTEKASQKSVTISEKPSKMKGKSSTTKNDDVCPICMDRIDVTNRKELHLCHHVFCRDCIDHCFAVSQHMCPVCKTVYGIITGNQPNGHMTEAFLKRKLPGYTSGTIAISYIFKDGIQKEDHPHKGNRYKGTKRSAYLPDNLEGQRAYRLLRKAFEQRLTFTIGSSRTTGKEDVVTWNDIHHKTRINGGPERYGYPDPGYIDRVLDELKAKGIVEE